MWRQWLRRQALYGSVLVAVAGGLTWDSGRPPGDQLTARAYIRLVRTYQHVLGPVMGRAVQCRFQPHCSDYSIEAVRRFGVRWGLLLTVRRVMACHPLVPVGTPDPVPPQIAGR